MNEIPDRGVAQQRQPPRRPGKSETAGRIFLLLAGGVLLSVLVSCACGPVR